MTFKPLGDFVAITPDKQEGITASGIVIPETAQKKTQSIGTIYALGDGKFGKRGEDFVDPKKIFTVGEKVLYGKYDGHDVEYKGLKLKIIRAGSIKAKCHQLSSTTKAKKTLS